MLVASTTLAASRPFDDVFVHGTLPRAATSPKLHTGSPDQLEGLLSYGADAFRFAVLSTTVQAHELQISPARLTHGRNFVNKIWHMTQVLRGMLRPEDTPQTLSLDDREIAALDLPERWILMASNRVIDATGKALTAYRFHEALLGLYHFVRNDLSGWYLEMAKLRSDSPSVKKSLYTVLERILRAVHPFVPFVTEYIWQRIPHENAAVMIAPWPQFEMRLHARDIDEQVAVLKGIIHAVRAVRIRTKTARRARPIVMIVTDDPFCRDLFGRYDELIRQMTNVLAFECVRAPDDVAGSALEAGPGFWIYVPISSKLDQGREFTRLRRRLARLRSGAKRLTARLADEAFERKAPQEIVQTTKQHLAYLEKMSGCLTACLRYAPDTGEEGS